MVSLIRTPHFVGQRVTLSSFVRGSIYNLSYTRRGKDIRIQGISFFVGRRLTHVSHLASTLFYRQEIKPSHVGIFFVNGTLPISSWGRLCRTIAFRVFEVAV